MIVGLKIKLTKKKTLPDHSNIFDLLCDFDFSVV